MSESQGGWRQQVELEKAAVLLGVAPDSLSYLADYDAATLQEFRMQVSDVMFESDRKRLAGAVKLVALVPAALLAKIAPVVVSGRAAAAVAGVLPIDKAVGLASRVPTTFLADLAPSLDQRRVRAIIGQIPSDTVRAVAKELDARGDTLTMGRLVPAVSEEAVAATVAVLSDSTLLRIAAYAEDSANMTHIVSTLSDERIAAILDHADRADEWRLAHGLLQVVSEPATSRIRAAVAARGVEAVERLEAAASA